VAYPEPHNYLTVHWEPGTVDETAQFGLRFDGPGPVSQTMVDDAAAAVQTWWASATGGVGNETTLKFLRLARIGTNGQYVPGTQSWDHNYAPAIAGGMTTSVGYPTQVSLVYSLRTALMHGLAHAGRVYAPPFPQALVAQKVWSTSGISSAVNTFAAMLSALNGSSLGNLVIYSKGNAAFPSGAKVQVTAVRADTRPDVQRRRAKNLARLLSVQSNVT